MLRDTDGERFVSEYKEAVFRENSQAAKRRALCVVICLLIENLLYVNLYPHLIELFAFQNWVLLTAFAHEFFNCQRWTTLNRERGCKNFLAHYNASPSLKATIAVSEALKSNPDLFIVFCRLIALINFCLTPLTCYAIPNQVLKEPTSEVEEAQAIHGDSLMQ